MSKKEIPKMTKEVLLKLLQEKNVKGARVFIEQMINQNRKAQNAIIEGLRNNLCEHNASVYGITTGLVFYKNILLTAEVSFFDDDQLFPKIIHEAVIENCNYQGKNINWRERGKKYFIEKLKLDQSSQIENYGNYYIILSLQIVQNMAQWYPLDFYTNKPSRFKLAYLKLIEQGITFPPLGVYTNMKPQDQLKFKSNYQAMKADYQNQDQNLPQVQNNLQKQQKQQKQTNKTTISNLHFNQNTNKLQSNITKDTTVLANNKQQQTSKKPIKDVKKQQIQQTSNIIKIQKNQNITKHKPLQKQQQKTKISIISSEADKIPDLMIKSNINTKPIEQSLQVNKNVQDVNEISKNNKPNSSEIKYQKKEQQVKENKKLNQKQIQPTFILAKQEVQNNPKGGQNKLTNQLIQKPIIEKKSSDKKQKKTQRLQQYQKNEPLSEQKKPQETQIKKLIKKINDLQIENEQLRQKQKYLISEVKQENVNFGSIKKKVKMQKYQHANKGDGSMQKNRDNQTYRIPIKNKKSLPKTEKSSMYLNETLNQKFKSFQKPKTKNSKLNQTLSELVTNRKNQNSKRYFWLKGQNNTNILTLINEIKLNQYTVPFLPEYFEPIKLNQHILRKMCLNLHTSTQETVTFYTDMVVECRLIKLNHFYILSFYNISGKPLNLSYLYEEMQTKLYCQRLKIYAHEQSSSWVIDANKYLDIKFSFRTRNLNFKFLQMCFKVNSRPLNLFLPITLLDNCDILPKIQIPRVLQYIYDHGRIFKSVPFILMNQKMPSFISSNHNTDKIKLKGEFQITLKRQECTNILEVLILSVNWTKKIVQIIVIFDQTNQSNEDFAKVIIQLITFLLSA